MTGDKGALPAEQLGCVSQVVEWATPGMLQVSIRKTWPQIIVMQRVRKDVTFIAIWKTILWYSIGVENVVSAIGG